jgi:hypothetical protein
VVVNCIDSVRVRRRRGGDPGCRKKFVTRSWNRGGADELDREAIGAEARAFTDCSARISPLQKGEWSGNVLRLPGETVRLNDKGDRRQVETTVKGAFLVSDMHPGPLAAHFRLLSSAFQNSWDCHVANITILCSSYRRNVLRVDRRTRDMWSEDSQRWRIPLRGTIRLEGPHP